MDLIASLLGCRRLRCFAAIIFAWAHLAGAAEQPAALAPQLAHWAFTPPQRPGIPKNQKQDWARNDLDRFVLARLEKEGVAPAPRADRAALLRRWSLDLTGLPPTPPELDAYLKDTSNQADQKQIERLLNSPRYGERWARFWLDAARYADSDGYEKDLPRQQWTYRDWVINALNRNVPYDQFVIAQIAGDLLPQASQEDQVATGFLRNAMVNEEGAIVAEQFRMESMFDRLDCIGKSVLGLTIQCAQCHSHKYDPLTQDEYYRLFAFLDNTYEAVSWVYSSEQLTAIDRIKRETAALEKQMQQDLPDWKKRLENWETQQTAIKWTVLDPTDFGDAGGVIHPHKLPDHSVMTLGFRPTRVDFYALATTSLTNITGLRIEALTHGDLPFGGPGRSYKGTFAVSELIVEAGATGTNSKPSVVGLTNITADFSQPETPLEAHFKRPTNDNRVVGPIAFLIDGKEDTAWATDAGPGRRHQDRKAVVQFKTNIAQAAGTQLKVLLKFRHGGEDIHGSQNNFLGRMRFSVTDSPNPTADPIPRLVREVLDTPAEKRTDQQKRALFSYWRTAVPEFKEANAKIDALWAGYPEGNTVLNLAERTPEHQRQTYSLKRGDWQKPDQVMTPGVPAFLHPLPPSTAPERLRFARWLVDPKSPTTARVIVNRIWQAYFGIGLVDTTEDFGRRAAAPSHPELLDWLATEFMASDWDLKALHRLIVSSATYQQAARLNPELQSRDPYNRLLAHGPRFRIDAEGVRDITLSIAGLLTERLGGPSVFPPVPDSLFSTSFIPVTFWNTAQGPDRYRRGLYVFRRRSIPDPVLAAFDAPNGDFSCVRRTRSNTPLAALTSLNETVFFEAAQALALRITREGGATDAQRAEYAFRLCTSRFPQEKERAEVLSLLRSRRERLAEGWLTARDIAFAEAKAPELPQGATPTDVAAWTIVARVLLNLDETITKN